MRFCRWSRTGSAAPDSRPKMAWACSDHHSFCVVWSNSQLPILAMRWAVSKLACTFSSTFCCWSRSAIRSLISWAKRSKAEDSDRISSCPTKGVGPAPNSPGPIVLIFWTSRRVGSTSVRWAIQRASKMPNSVTEVIHSSCSRNLFQAGAVTASRVMLTTTYMPGPASSATAATAYIRIAPDGSSACVVRFVSIFCSVTSTLSSI